MFARSILFMAITFILVGPALAADDDAIKKELEKIQGTWQVIGGEYEGKQMSKEEAATWKMVIKNKQLTIIIDGITSWEGSFQIVEAKGKTRKTNLIRGPEKETNFTIAEWIDADTFRTCVGDPRPTKFASKGEGAGLAVFVFKRVKK